ncbi:MAG: hypothetical protein KJO53_05930 [Eudoraea sp.]|nr:hypothetical protein [Eudoraea sp.]
MKKLTLNCLIIIIVATQMINISCSSDDNGIEIAEVLSERTIDTKLVGTWNGTMEGSTGTAVFVFTLQMSGEIIAETDSQVLCPFQGAWWVSNKKFTASGEDECGGTAIELLGDNASSIEISGNWTASNGNNGTFSMTKQ